MRRRDEGADEKARVGAEGSEETTQVGRVREFKRRERGWVEAGIWGGGLAADRGVFRV